MDPIFIAAVLFVCGVVLFCGGAVLAYIVWLAWWLLGYLR